VSDTVASNRKARHDYHIEESFEAGIILQGSEVKSLRGGKASLQDAYAMVRGDEIFLLGAHIAPYPQASMRNHEPTRPRKLLLHRKEIQRLIGKTKEKGLTLVPLRIYIKDNLFKVEIALARGKQTYDKRQTIAKREAEREMQRRQGTARRSGG
jgi:SsrA-binding protein